MMRKPCSYYVNTGLLILRLIILGYFLPHVIEKFNPSPDIVAYIGSIPLNLGIAFLSMSTWFLILLAAEIFIVVSMALGLWTRAGIILLWIVMLFAIFAKYLSGVSIELELILVGV